ncbi:MAG: hypothetical protein KHX03_03660 [Clostridium sp.]|nr:hypothetical protein [Clostridium sp.]
MSIQAVSFGAKTQKGNEYKKTHAGTITGLAVGTGYAGLCSYGIAKNPEVKNKIARILVKTRQDLMSNGLTKEVANKYTKFTRKAGISLTVASAILVGLGIGAAVNKVINKNRAKQADQKAEQA